MKVAKEGAWLTNPWVDSMLLIGLPAIFVLLLMAYPLKGLLPSKNSTILKELLTFLATVHLIATYLIIYLDKNELRNKLFRYLYIPLLVTFIYTALRYGGFRNLGATIFFYLIVAHVMLQYSIVMQAYNFTQTRYLKIDAIINNTALLLGPLYFFLWSSKQVNFHYGGKVFNISLNPYFLGLVGLLAFFSITAFITRQIYIYLKQKKIAVFNLLMVLTSNGIFYLSLFVFKNGEIFLFTVVRYHHALQYLVLIILYAQAKLKEYKINGPEFVSGFHLPYQPAFLMLFFIFATFILLTITKASKFFFPGNITQDLIFYFFASFHISIDAFLWWNIKEIVQFNYLKQSDS